MGIYTTFSTVPPPIAVQYQIHSESQCDACMRACAHGGGARSTHRDMSWRAADTTPLQLGDWPRAADGTSPHFAARAQFYQKNGVGLALGGRSELGVASSV